jgi:3-oxoacyl-[acyl-carrier-protein] synthase-1
VDNDVVVAGLGMISALGKNIAETLISFENHRSGVHKVNNLPTIHKDLSVAEIPYTNEQLAAQCGLSSSISRTILLSYIATKEAIGNLPARFSDDFRAGYFSATTVGGMDKTELFFEDYILDENGGDVESIKHHDCGKITDFVARKLGFKGMVTTISTACSSSANAIMMGARMIKNDMLDIVVAGGTDALTKFTLNGFNTLQILDKEQCRPLDESRAGLNLGEGAAYVVMMKKELAEKLGQEIFCKIAGYHNSNDSFHQTALSDDAKGPLLAMQGALKMSGLIPEDISYINMHGTGTRNNDSAEGLAIKNIFEPHYPMLSSTKSFTGHTLGAAGAVEAVLSALSIKNGIVFPNYIFTNKMEGLEIIPETKMKKGAEIKNVLSNSFGFGGNCTSLIFSAN